MTAVVHIVDHPSLSAPGGAYSQAVIANGFISLAGQTGQDPATGTLREGLEAQIEQAIANVQATLQACGADLADLVKVTCFLPAIERFDEFDAVYRRCMPQPWPTRATIGTPLAPGLEFEIEGWAVAP